MRPPGLSPLCTVDVLQGLTLGPGRASLEDHQASLQPRQGQLGAACLHRGEIEEWGGEGKAATPGEGGGGGRAQVLVIWGEKKGKRGKNGEMREEKG